AGCSTPKRVKPLPEELAKVAQIPGIPGARVWGDVAPDSNGRWFERSDSEVIEHYSGVYAREHQYLSISGGGPDGAFGAGLLCGWTEHGDRPQFTLVSGISTGALIAPFAFLGPEYDSEMKRLYTSHSTKDLGKQRSVLSTLLGSSVMDTSRMRDKVEEFFPIELLDAIAEEARKGRSLQIGTTNLDARRPVVWNIGRIAMSESPGRLRLFHDVLLASAAVPGAFDPVLFEVEAEGELYDELHVDGGATTQLFLYPVGLDWGRVMEKLKVPGNPTVYTIRNAKLASDYRIVQPWIVDISASTVFSLMRTSGLGDIYRLYLAARRDGLAFRLASIPRDFAAEAEEPFDREYMRALFAVGYDLAVEGYPWDASPPGFDFDDEDIE
ncbi:MAG: patatin-like phospholipase family protein, partial [Planctomycetota bacterium]